MASEKVPFDHPWDEDIIGEVADVVVGGTPSTVIEAYWRNGSVPWMSSGDVHFKRVFDVPGRITELGLARSNAKLIDPPNVAIALAGQGKTRGTVALVLAPMSTNQSVALIRGDGKRLETVFLFHALDARYEDLRARSAGGGRAGLSKSILEATPIALPPPCEQRVIAAILDTIDDAIRHTEQLIAKLKQVRAGLLHDLLTYGIDENGDLRDPVSHPEQFKESELGPIPRTWKSCTIDALAVYVGSGVTPRGGREVYSDSGVLFIRSQNVQFEGLDLTDVAFIDSQTHQSMLNSEVFPHDVLLNITGASIGRCCPLPDGLGLANVNQHVCAIRLDKPSREDAIYLAAVLSSSIGQSQIKQLNAGGSREGLNYRQVRSLKVPWPEDGLERAGIAHRLMALDERLQQEAQTLGKLGLLKQGLMDDLLTGKVRVTPLLEEIE